jgi:hypothetical protein
MVFRDRDNEANMIRNQLLPIGLLLVLFTAQRTNAQEADAREQFKLGIALFEEKKFEQAAIAFERAYELKPSYKLLFNIGQVNNELGKYTDALVAYRQYLKEGADDIPQDRATQVQEEIARLETLVGAIQIAGGPDGATVYIDRRAVGTIPLDNPVIVDIGEHTVAARQGTSELHSEIVKVAGRENVIITIPEVSQKDESSVSSTESPPPLPPASKRRWTWVAAGVGAATLLTGSIVGAVSVSKRKDIESQCVNNVCDTSLLNDRDQMENLSLAADILLITGAAGVTAGVILFFVEPRWAKDRLTPVAMGPALHGRGINFLFTRNF